MTITETREIPVNDGFDLIVAGGGVAGIAAALAAARQGLKTMLAEKSVLLGGLATLGLINWYEPLCDGEGRLQTTGIAEELLRLSVSLGYSNLAGQWKKHSLQTPDFIAESPRPRYATVFNPMVFALSLNELLIKEGIELRYDMLASYPVMEGARCTGLIMESSGGREFFPANVVIDASGDADIAARAGLPCRLGSNYLTYAAKGCTRASLEKTFETQDMIALNDNVFWRGSDLFGKGQPDNFPVMAGIENRERSLYVRQGQTILLEKIKSMPNDACLYALPGMAQLRKTRCIVGADTFTAEDGKRRDDSVGAAGDFRKPGRHFEFPFGIVFNPGFPNILAAGRVVSAQDDGWEITRVIPGAALTGEVSGIAASLMVKQRRAAAELDVKAVQARLVKNNVRLHF